MAHIVPILLNAMRDHLEQVLITNGDPSAPWTPSEVKIGRFLADPVKAVVRISLIPGDPEDPNYKDGIASLETMQNINFELPWNREIGGGEMWMRRATAVIECYWMRDRLDEIDAMNNSYVAAGKVAQAIQSLDTSALLDEFGEQALYIFLYAQTFVEGGGKNQFMWRGKLLWEVLTERP